jgi:hypothetical protein
VSDLRSKGEAEIWVRSSLRWPSRSLSWGERMILSDVMLGNLSKRRLRKGIVASEIVTKDRRRLVIDRNCFERTERDLKLPLVMGRYCFETWERVPILRLICLKPRFPSGRRRLNVLLSSSLRNLKMCSHNSSGKYERVAAIVFETLNLDDVAIVLTQDSIVDVVGGADGMEFGSKNN